MDKILFLEKEVSKLKKELIKEGECNVSEDEEVLTTKEKAELHDEEKRKKLELNEVENVLGKKSNKIKETTNQKRNHIKDKFVEKSSKENQN